MKSCPTCQQLYSDALEICPTDGSTLLSSSLGYSPGGSSSGYKWQSGQANWQQQQPPPPGWGYYPPPGAYPPYGGYNAPYPPPSPGGEGLATAALWTGISTAGCIAFGILLAATAERTTYTEYGYRYSGPSGAAVFGGVLVFLSFIVGLTALILGIVAASMSSRNPAISKPKAIVGLCLGAVPYLILIIGMIVGASLTGRRF